MAPSKVKIPKTIERRHCPREFDPEMRVKPPIRMLTRRHGGKTRQAALVDGPADVPRCRPPNNDHLALLSRTWVGEGLEEARRQIKPFW